jgi:hypothetical protein
MMKGLRFLAVLAATSVLSMPALSAFQSGNDLLKYCSAKSNLFDGGLCFGFVEAVADIMGTAQRPVFGFTACFVGDVGLSEISDVTINFLNSHPERRHLGAASLVAHALSDAFPCKP